MTSSLVRSQVLVSSNTHGQLETGGSDSAHLEYPRVLLEISPKPGVLSAVVVDPFARSS